MLQDKSFTPCKISFNSPLGFAHPKTRTCNRLLGPCFKTGVTTATLVIGVLPERREPAGSRARGPGTCFKSLSREPRLTPVPSPACGFGNVFLCRPRFMSPPVYNRNQAPKDLTTYLPEAHQKRRQHTPICACPKRGRGEVPFGTLRNPFSLPTVSLIGQQSKHRL
jgi:hypothetical protein